MQNRTRDAVIAMEKAQQTRAQEVEQDLQRLPEWPELTAEEQGSVFADLENLALSVSHDLDGLKRLINQKFEIQSLVSDLKQRIASIGEQRQRQRLEEEKAKAEQAGRTKLSRALTVPTRITGVQQLETLIRDLQALQNELALYSEIEISIELKD
jgi:vacuolar-type H+-ATPase subunit I/STV1